MRHVLVCLILGLALGGAAAAQEARLDGLGPYQFGMSLSDARATSPNAAWRVEPGPQRTQSLSGGPRIVFADARFGASLLFDNDSEQLKRIVVIGAARGGCIEGVRSLLAHLEAAYGAFGSAPAAWETADITNVVRTDAGSELRISENEEGVRVYSTRRGTMIIQVFGEPQTLEGEAGCRLSITFAPLPSPVTTTSGPSAEEIDRAETLVRPVMVERPSGRSFARHYPRRAIETGISGEVVLDCLVSADGALRCAVVEETPPRQGFGEAALAIAQDFRIQVDESGASATGKRLRIPIGFRVSG